MKSVCLVLFGILLAAPVANQTTAAADVVSEVRAAIGAHDLDRADAIFTERRGERGNVPEIVEARSWLGRGALVEGQLNRADRYAREAQRLAAASLANRALDGEPRLATALGARIEVQAQVRGQRGQRSDAVYFLQRQLEIYQEHVHPQADSEEHQPSWPRGTASTHPRSFRIHRVSATNARGVERESSRAVLLGALVPGLQNSRTDPVGTARQIPDAGTRRRGADSALRLCGRWRVGRP